MQCDDRILECTFNRQRDRKKPPVRRSTGNEASIVSAEEERAASMDYEEGEDDSHVQNEL